MYDPASIVGISFWLMTLAMAGTSAFLLLERRRLPGRWQAPVTLAGAVSLVSALNYYTLAGVWASEEAVSTVYRFAEWQLTVPMQVVCFYLIVAVTAQAPAALFWRLLVAAAVSVAAAYLGAAGYLSPTLGFLVSLGGGLYILGELYLGEASKINAGEGKGWGQRAFTTNRLIATVGWAIYPLGYFMEYLGGGVETGAINLIYNLADFLNKVAFGLVIYLAAAKDADSNTKPFYG